MIMPLRVGIILILLGSVVLPKSKCNSALKNMMYIGPVCGAFRKRNIVKKIGNPSYLPSWKTKISFGTKQTNHFFFYTLKLAFSDLMIPVHLPENSIYLDDCNEITPWRKPYLAPWIHAEIAFL